MHASIIFLTLALGAHRIEQKTTISGPPQMAGQVPQQSILLWDGAKMRTDSGTEQSTIVDYKTDSMLMLNHKAKEYSEMKISDMLKSLRAAMDAMKKQIESMPPEQRKAMESMLGEKGALQIEKTDSSDKIIGFDAKKYKLKQDGKDVGEVWYTKAIDMSDVAPYAKRFSEMTKGMMGASWADVLAKVENGYPLRSTITLDVMGQRASYTTETLKYEKVTPPATAFNAPQGYKKVDPPKAPGMPGGGAPGR